MSRNGHRQDKSTGRGGIMKRHPFVNTNLIQTIDEEIKLLEEGTSNIEQAKSVVKVAERLISLKMFEIQEEEKALGELKRKINDLKSK